LILVGGGVRLPPTVMPCCTEALSSQPAAPAGQTEAMPVCMICRFALGDMVISRTTLVSQIATLGLSPLVQTPLVPSASHLSAPGKDENAAVAEFTSGPPKAIAALL
jgi:hypothetical protein